MLNLPNSTSENPLYLRTKQRYYTDPDYRQNLMDAYVAMNMIENNTMDEDYLREAQKLAPLFVDVKRLLTPDIADVNDSVATIIGKLENIATISNVNVMNVQQRIFANAEKLVNRIKEQQAISDEKPAPTPRQMQSIMTLFAPIILRNKTLFPKHSKFNQKSNRDLVLFINDVITGIEIIEPEQGKELWAEMMNSVKSANLPLEWKIVLTQDLDQKPQLLDALINGQTEEISKEIVRKAEEAPTQRMSMTL